MPKWTTALLVVVAVSGCAPSPTPAPVESTPLTISDFREEILDPLATRVTEDKIKQAQAKAKFEFAKRERERAEKGKADADGINFLSGAAALLGHPWVGMGLNALKNHDEKQRLTTSQIEAAQLNEFIAWTETQHEAVKKKVLDTLVSRTTENEGIFSLCLPGLTRHYRVVGGRFSLATEELC